ncbi:hypothetical protein [Catellatospora sichuanensis]|uniref:hypothetical protein n=1 Tax=Catellatospora sichuanensis TaxID=1969805 RepID=UPI00118282B5|nr:hypothetical protein [Catellatospora sichuanensis]
MHRQLRTPVRTLVVLGLLALGGAAWIVAGSAEPDETPDSERIVRAYLDARCGRPAHPHTGWQLYPVRQHQDRVTGRRRLT